MARGGAVTLAGAAYAAVGGFLLTLAVGRLFGAHVSGLLFMAVAVFMILNGLALLGSDTGMIRAVSAARAVRAHQDVWLVVRCTVGPVLVWSLVVAGSLAALAEPLARVLTPDDVGVGSRYLRILAVTLVFSAAGQACLNGTRSFGSLRPFVLLYQVWLPTSRLAFLGVLWAFGAGRDWLLWTWVVPLLLMDVLAVGYVVRASARERHLPGLPGRRPREVLADVWRFNIPRGFASMFEIGIVWVDVLLVGVFLGPAAAGAYAAASRFITSGTMAMEALRVGTAPMLAEACARRETDRVQGVYALSSVWLVLLSWPMFLALAAFAPLLMSFVGEGFAVAAPAMTVMALAILGYLALGNINSVLLMAGLSRVTAGNTLVALLVNIGLNVVLIPTVGLVGAAVAWAASLTLDSVLCAVRGGRLLGVAPPWGGLLLAGAVAVASFGVPGLALRLLVAPTLAWLAVYAVLATGCYALLLLRFRERLGLQNLPEILRRPR